MSKLAANIPEVRVSEDYDKNELLARQLEEQQRNIKGEFKSAIDETISTVCRVASLSEQEAPKTQTKSTTQ